MHHGLSIGRHLHSLIYAAYFINCDILVAKEFPLFKLGDSYLQVLCHNNVVSYFTRT